MSKLSFQEKSTIGTLLATSVIGLLYLRSAWQLWQADQLHVASMTGLAAGLTVLLVIALVVYHALVAAITQPEHEDERDRLIAWRAGNIGGLILGIGVIGVVLQILVGGIFGDPVAGSPVLIANALMAVVFCATIVELSMKLVYYRRGI
ncbi:MAG TPA: hypothetical protein VKO38_00025 [Wenzhouxiangella sp.]|nr:hypothetical protein [Wenzhouxiangella sp.]